jgi:PAS domain S-box-containing protein
MPQQNVIMGIRKPGGAKTWISINAVPIFDSESPKPSAAVVSFADITERKLAKMAVQEERDRLAALIRSMQDEVWFADTKGQFTLVNPKGDREFTLGDGSSQDVRKLAESLEVLRPDGSSRPVDEAPPLRALRGELVTRQQEIVRTPVSGKFRHREVSAAPVRDSQARIIGSVSVVRDVTERNRLEQALLTKNAELVAAMALAEKASQAKSEFLSSMSHELRTPLNAILGFAQLLESNGSPPTPSQKRCIDQILSGGWFLLELVNEILDLAQIESGKAVVTREAVPLEHIMSECQELVEPLASKHGVEMSFPRMERPHWVDADRTRTRQVLINLLHNAIKYNRPGGMVSIACTLVPPNSARISVRDTGPGLSPEQLDHLFQPFNRLGRESGAEQGTGIGLVVVKRLVELMGGVIGVESQVGVGSVFWVELKLTTAPLLTTRRIRIRTDKSSNHMRPSIAPWKRPRSA